MKPCPFCGKEPRVDTFKGSDNTVLFELVYCQSGACIMWRMEPMSPSTWNERPVEDTLQKEIEYLKDFIARKYEHND